MKLLTLQLEQFRNLGAVTIEPDYSLTVISGLNGQGKTNLLESIWMLSGAKSFRAGRECELVQRGESWCRITGTVENEQIGGTADTLQITVKLDTTGKRGSRTGKKNNVDWGRAGNLAGQFPCVIFAPEHIQMLNGAPEGRRRFIDGALGQLYPGYLEARRRYDRSLLQKNTYLKNCRMEMPSVHPDGMLLDSFDEQLATTGAEIIRYRQEYLKMLCEDTANQYAGISMQKEKLQLRYLPGVPEGADIQALRESFRLARSVDERAGFCTVGPHRDDIEFLLDGYEAKTWASQGQRRSIVLSLKSAELSCINRITGLCPVLLLDDVLSELDDTRQDYLLNRMEGKQVFITGCNPALFSGTGGKIIRLENGTVCP